MTRFALVVVCASCATPMSGPHDQPDAATTGSDGSGGGGDGSSSMGDVVIVGAGDIAGGGPGAIATAELIKTIPGTVFTLGDNAYNDGTANEFTTNFDPTWGQFKSRILLPTTGNHDYHTANAAGYFGYFGAAAGDPSKGYYSVDVGAWHVIVINSNCSVIGGCAAGSPQETWLRADLAAHTNACTLAMWHHPLFNIGMHGPETAMLAIYQALYDANADVVLTGHDHDYQRWAPVAPDGTADPARGIRNFVVGTGGVGFYDFPSTNANVESKDNQTYGVLKLTLSPTSYKWEFIHEPSKTFSDSGSGICH